MKVLNLYKFTHKQVVNTYIDDGINLQPFIVCKILLQKILCLQLLKRLQLLILKSINILAMVLDLMHVEKFSYHGVLCMTILVSNGKGLLIILLQTQPPNNIPRTSLYGPILVKTSQIIIEPKQNVLGFSHALALQCLVCTWHPKTQKNLLKNLFYMDLPRTSHCRCHFQTFLGRLYDVSPKLEEHTITTF